MGYKRKKKIYKLDFTGTEYEGLEVRAGGLNTGEFLEFVALSGSENSGETEKMLQFFANHLIDWNLEDDGGPVPATFDGLKSIELSMAMFVTNAWTDAMISVPAGTEKKSDSGDSSLEGSIPTQAL